MIFKRNYKYTTLKMGRYRKLWKGRERRIKEINFEVDIFKTSRYEIFLITVLSNQLFSAMSFRQLVSSFFFLMRCRMLRWDHREILDSCVIKIIKID